MRRYHLDEMRDLIAPQSLRNQALVDLPSRFCPSLKNPLITGYQDETRRLYGVLEIRLKDKEYLAGVGKGKYSIADINVFPWYVQALHPYLRFSNLPLRVNGHAFAGIESLDEWPGVKAWVERIKARSAVQAGLNVPA